MTQASSEMLDLIKARTMYQMVEEIDGGARKLLFLSNVQAEQIAQRPESLQKMLDALEVGRPQLLIDLITSGGFREYTSLAPKNTQGVLDDGFMGLLADGPPFASREAERAAEAKIDSFMADILIPLAVNTHAVVLCNAVTANCILSRSFIRMYCLVRGKYADKPLSPCLAPRAISKCCTAMRTRTRIGVRCAGRRVRGGCAIRSYWGVPTRPAGRSVAALAQLRHRPERHDRCAHRQHPPEKGSARYCAVWDVHVRPRAPPSSSLPSLAIRTGMSQKVPIELAHAFQRRFVPVTRAESGTPMLLLDVHPHALPGLMPGNELSRKALIDAAKKQITDQCDALLSTGVAETLDCCTLAFLNDVLRGSGDLAAGAVTHRTDMPVLCMRPFAAHGAPVMASMSTVARCHRQPKRR